MPEKLTEQKLPQELAESIGKTVYYYGKLQELSGDKMLALSDALAPYYPPTDEETAAALTLREWREARQVRETAERALKELIRGATCGVEAWSEMVRCWHRESEGRRERRRYREERNYEELPPDLLHKEMSYQLKSGDPHAMILAMQRLIEDALDRREVLPVNTPPPDVSIPPEWLAASKELAEASEEKLAPFVERAAAAKQCLSRYIYRVIAAERITAQKD